MHALHTPDQAAQWLRGRVSGQLRTDSRQVVPGDGFIAWPGASTDGRQHVAAALAQGAAACLVEAEGVERFGLAGEAVASLAGLKAATGAVAAAYFDDPSGRLDVVAVTGTNGKTSTTWWLAQALSNLKPLRAVPCGLIGTLGVGQVPGASKAGVLHTNGLTTPDPVLIQQALRRMLDQGLRACALEASSIGLAEHRLDATRLKVAVFSNFTQDHLDYHGSMDAYWQAKRALFDWPGLQAAVVNIDDLKGQALAQELQARGGPLALWTLSCQGGARLYAERLGHDAQGLRFVVVETHGAGEERHTLATPFVGMFNAANLLAVLGAMRALGVPLAEAVEACRRLRPVPGRMQRVAEPRSEPWPLVLVDYAHTPDALDQALAALQAVARQRGGRLWCVFGCGGDRDPLKRPLMGAVAVQRADRVVVTSDNPRREPPAAIIAQILQGMPVRESVQVEPDRALAITDCIAGLDARDVLIAGKGHEDYQEVAGVRLPFSDTEHAGTALRNWAAPAGQHA